MDRCGNHRPYRLQTLESCLWNLANINDFILNAPCAVVRSRFLLWHAWSGSCGAQWFAERRSNVFLEHWCSTVLTWKDLDGVEKCFCVKWDSWGGINGNFTVNNEEIAQFCQLYFSACSYIFVTESKAMWHSTILCFLSLSLIFCSLVDL